jgi:hypothetical protein
MTLRIFRRPHLSAMLALSCAACLSVTSACTRSRPEGTPAVGAGADELGGVASGEDVPRELAAPSRATLTDRRYSPFHHNPVSWRFVNTRVLSGGQRSDVRLAMTTTPERVVLDGIGLLFKLVLEIQLPGPDGVTAESDYRSHVALLTPEGLYMSEANILQDELAPAAAELAAELLRDEPTWPLPGSLACTHRLRDVALPLGPVRGVETHCPSVRSPYGRAEVRTLWVDRVGFVYREVRPREGDAAGDVYYDILAGGDLAELALQPEGGRGEALGP